MTDYPTPPPDEAPTSTSPTGPVWIVDDGGETYRVRRLPGDPGLLKLGVTLQHNASVNHPRLQSPTRWWRHRDDTWIAAPHLDQTPVADTDRPRPTWSEALEAFRPLALALRSAHRSGLVHGHLAPWNTCLDETTGRLTALDFGTWPHESLEPGPFVAPEVRSDSPNPSPATDVYNLARLLVFIALSPQEARRSRPNFETLPAYAISTLERALAPDPELRPQTVDDLLAGLTFEASPDAPQTVTGDETTVTGRVRDIETFDHPKRGRGIRFRLDTPDDSESPGVFAYRDQQRRVFDSLSHLWAGAELTLIEPRTIEDSAGNLFLTADDETLPVIEPHWPVSVSDVLKARGCPQRVMVDTRDSGERTHHLPFGTLVHQFLEDLTHEPGLCFEQALAKRLPKLRIDFLSAGVDDEQLAQLVDDARRHFEHLRQFTARRTAGADAVDRVGWCGELAEATRYSSRYGLEGRTDLVVTDPDEGLQIIELKSGKPWHDHPGQVKSYALLWSMLANRHDLATTGHLLYSKNGRMKEVPLDDAEKKELIHGRNGLLAMSRSLVDPTYDYRPPHYMQKPGLCRENACRFRRDRCRQQTNRLGLDTPEPDDTRNRDLAHQYHRHWTRLLEMERWTDHTMLGAIFRPELLPQRVADGRAAADLELRAVDDGAQALLIGDDLHVFTPGDRLLVHRGDIDTHHVLRARVVERRPTTADTDADSLAITLRDATVSDDWIGPGWIADQMPTRIGYRTAHRALYRTVTSGPDDLCDVLFRPHRDDGSTLTPVGELPDEIDEATSDHLDDSQLHALRRGLADRPATLIQGPPGTGKTTVIAHLCRELVDRHRTVLLSALTNTAVDTMLVQLLEAADVRGETPPEFLRLGRRDRSPILTAELERRGLDPTEYFADELAADIDGLDSLADRLDTIPVVATTAHSALRHPATTFYERRRDDGPFDVALVDDASQLTEPMALAPLSLARRSVLVGDHRQLPPIVTSERALSAFLTGPEIPSSATTDSDVDDSSPQPALFGSDTAGANVDGESPDQRLRQAGIAGLDRSLFERLARFIPVDMLTTQYRMHREIMAFPAEAFYDDRLSAHPSVAERSLEIDDTDHPPLAHSAPVVFADIEGTEVGRTNPDEARRIIATVGELVDAAPTTTVGILSPFRAQVHLLRRLRDDAGLPDRVDIDTVERFQGNERDVILASLVKTDHPGDFVADTRRLNVALTRARKKLIVFGRRECLERDPTFRDWLDAGVTEIVTW